MAFWVEDHDGVKVGEIGFVVKVLREGVETTEIRSCPARTNRSREARLRGWCGSTNGVSLTADGAGEVLRRSTRDLDRVQVRGLPDDDPRVAALWEEMVG